MAEADETQVRILNENRQHLESLVTDAYKDLHMQERLKAAALDASEALRRFPYLAGAIVILLSDVAERIRCYQSIDWKTVEATCDELRDLRAELQ